MCYKGYFRDDLHFCSFLLGKKVSRAFCAGDRCCSANSDTRYPLANRQVLQTFRRRENGALHLHLTQFKFLSACVSLHISVEICTSARATPLEDCCKETWGYPGSQGRAFALVLFTYTLSLLPGTHSRNLRLAWVLTNTSDLSLVCLSFWFHGLRIPNPLQERKNTLEDESLAWVLKAVSAQPLFYHDK